MRKPFALFISLCFTFFNFQAFSQTKDYKKDVLIIDSLTKDLKTYSFKLITKDTSVYFPSGYQSELATTFRFLKKKKLVTKQPDVTFNVLINNILLQYPYTSIEQPTSFNPNNKYLEGRYKVHVNYTLSMVLQILTKDNREYNIALISNEDFQDHFYVSIPNPNNNTMGVTRPDVGTIVERYTQEFTTNIPHFITDLNFALQEYRRK